MTDDQDRYLPLRELVAYAGLSEGTLRRLLTRADRPLPHYRVGARVLVKRSEFDAWLQGEPAAPKGRAADPIAAMADAAVRAMRGTH